VISQFFSCKFLQIHSGHFAYYIFKTVAVISMTSQFHECFNVNFGRFLIFETTVRHKVRLVPKPAKNEVWAITSGCCLLFHIDINGCLWGRGICHVYSANIARKNAMLPSESPQWAKCHRGACLQFSYPIWPAIQPHNSKKHQQIKNKPYFVCCVGNRL
jgi:hypothetical protein